MSTKSKFGRTELLDENSLKTLLHDDSKLVYRPAPDPEIAAGSVQQPVWRVRFEMLADPARRFGLDINGEVKLGRGGAAPDTVDLSPYGADDLGVSRQHLILRPTPTNLFVIDLGSTNGTLRNGRSIGIRTPYALVDGDVLSLGKLQLAVRIIDRPHPGTAPLQRAGITLTDALSQIAKAITSQLDLDEALNQVAATAMSLTAAAEAGIWLIDERSGELFLEAERGMDDEWVRRKRIPLQKDSLVEKVVRTGKAVRSHHLPGEKPLKITTGYLAEGLAYVPIALGGITFGVLTVVHREPGRIFDDQDEQLLTAVADFAAIAIQNARLFQATDKALEQRVRELSALNEVSRAVSSSLDLSRVYRVLVEEVNKYCPVEGVQLFLRHRRENSLTVLRQRDDENGRNAAYSFSQGIIGAVAQTNKLIVTNEATRHSKYDRRIDGLYGEDVLSIAAIPLTSQEQVVGVLALFNKKQGEFTDGDINLLESFTNPVATAIENARLFEESERQRIAIQATAETLDQPLLLLDDLGNLLVANEAANALLNIHMAQLFEAISAGVGRTTEVKIGEKTYLSTTEHLSEVGTIVIMQDITYVKQLEKDRSEFMHMLSHDLKNPLMAITGWASLLERTVLLDEKSGRFIEEINVAAGRMLKMINQLLDTVDHAATVQLTRQPTQLAEVIQQILVDVKGAALHKNINLSFNVSGKSYPILADKTRLYHMVLNLVDNAIKYSPQNTHVEVLAYFADEDITIQVRDEGPGIPEEDLERIFDKYFRSVHKNIAAGSGLGLSAVRAIVEAHGGTVRAENRPERGVAFTIILPGTLRLSDEAGEEDD